MYTSTTHNVTVSVMPTYLANESNPDKNLYVWAYTVTITNNGEKTVQLLRRHWKIIDAHGYTHEVRGHGVVGEQPILKQGESFEYTSGTPLSTPSGFMVGTYIMADEDGGPSFDVAIPAFSLDTPNAPKRVN